MAASLACGYGASPLYSIVMQMAMLSVYVMLGATSVLDICHAAAKPQGKDTVWASNVLSSTSNCLAAHAILWLATIIHRYACRQPIALARAGLRHSAAHARHIR